MCATGVQALSLDALVDMPKIAPQVPSDIVLIGNVNPVSTLLQADPPTVRRKTQELMAAMADYDNFVISTGCDLPAETPIENIIAFVEAAREFPSGS